MFFFVFHFCYNQNIKRFFCNYSGSYSLVRYMCCEHACVHALEFVLEKVFHRRCCWYMYVCVYRNKFCLLLQYFLFEKLFYHQFVSDNVYFYDFLTLFFVVRYFCSWQCVSFGHNYFAQNLFPFYDFLLAILLPFLLLSLGGNTLLICVYLYRRVYDLPIHTQKYLWILTFLLFNHCSCTYSEH